MVATGLFANDADTLEQRAFKDYEHMGHVFNSNKLLLGENVFNGSFGYLFAGVPVQAESGFVREYRHAAYFSLRARMFEEFFVQTSLFKDFNKDAVQIWTADFYYSIGRFNWRPNTFDYGYENYVNNKFTDNIQTLGDKFLQGFFFGSYKHSLPTKFMEAIRLDESTSLIFNWFLRYHINYLDEFEEIHGGIFDGKLITGVSCRFTVFKNFYLESAFYYYPEEHKKAPWDPDFTYGFGYFDWRAFRLSLTYGNWVVNRLPWNEKEIENYGFIDGEFRLSFNYAW
ncbi:MAG: hypothetical protein EA412_02980 [Chitinophagaceae bacterium]|nr:MAG: hypothetical protein EA412_02980 [Chitinophagaceae bacterium]